LNHKKTNPLLDPGACLNHKKTNPLLNTGACLNHKILSPGTCMKTNLSKDIPTITPYNNNEEGAKGPSSLLFNNLIWLTTKETAVYLRRSVNSIHTLVSRKKLRARKFLNRLYFKKEELDYLIETSTFKGV
jgi:hypothetical protein